MGMFASGKLRSIWARQFPRLIQTCMWQQTSLLAKSPTVKRLPIWNRTTITTWANLHLQYVSWPTWKLWLRGHFYPCSIRAKVGWKVIYSEDHISLFILSANYVYEIGPGVNWIANSLISILKFNVYDEQIWVNESYLWKMYIYNGWNLLIIFVLDSFSPKQFLLN